MNRGFSKDLLRVALLLPVGSFYRNPMNEILTWPLEEDYVAESFNNYYLGGTAKIVIVNKDFEIVE